MAPDGAAALSARKIAKTSLWRALGANQRAFWGEFQGSSLYQTRVALPNLATKCTCPSRKLPCKHGLALLFLMADAESAFPLVPEENEPEWVKSWLSKQSAADARKRARASGEAKPVDLEARAKRAGKRHANVLAGVEQLEVWLADQLRRGLGRLPSEGPELWDAQARRLIDAQAPGLASRVRSAGARVGIGDAWAERVLGELGQLALLTHAYRRLEALPPPLREEVRRLVGFTLDKEEVVAHGDLVEDEWVVVSSRVTEDERLRIERVWLSGSESRRNALVLQVSAGGRAFQEVFVIGSAVRGTLAFWPGAHPTRAFFVERGEGLTFGRVPAHTQNISQALDDYATALAANPWLGRQLVLLEAIAIARTPEGDFFAVGSEGEALRIAGREHAVLYALSGGYPLLLAAEWNGFVLDPLTAFREGLGVALAPEEE